MKSLINKLIGKIRKGALIAAAVASLGVASCDLNGNKPDPVNHPPVITSFPAVREVNEGNSYNYDVNATDSDYDSLEYSLITAPSWLSINPNSGMISGVAPQVDADTGFNIEAGVSDGVNSVVKQNYGLTVKNVVVPPIDYLDVEGYFKKLDTQSAGSAIIKIFDKNSTIPIAQVESDTSTGYFSFHSTNKKVSDLSGVVVEAAAKENGTWKSFLVRENFPAGDVTIPESRAIMAKLFPSYSTPSEFKTFMSQISMSRYGVTRFDLENANGIEILLKNCDDNKNWGTSGDPSIGWQYLNDPQNSKSILKNGIEDFVGGEIIGDNLSVYVNGQQKVIPIMIETSPLSQDHYTIQSNLILPNLGWIILVPNKTIGGGQTSFFWDFDGSRSLIKRTRIDLGVVNNVVPMHETGHSLIAPNPDYNGHCNIPPFYYSSPSGANTLTIMTPNNISLTRPGVADIDARKIEYNYLYTNGKHIDDTLGQTFSDGEAVY